MKIFFCNSNYFHLFFRYFYIPFLKKAFLALKLLYIGRLKKLGLTTVKQLSCLPTKEPYFIFNGFLYKIIDAVAMGSLLGASLGQQGFKKLFLLKLCRRSFRFVQIK